MSASSTTLEQIQGRLTFPDCTVHRRWTLYGERGGNRTHNLMVKSHLLFLLSYAPANLVGMVGFEPTTTRLPDEGSSKLSYTPIRKMDCKRDSVIDNHSSCSDVTAGILARHPGTPWHDHHPLLSVAAPALSPVSPRLNWLVSVAVTHLSVGGRYPPGCAMQSRLSSP